MEKISPEEEPFSIYNRHLPHWRLTGATYFVTWRLLKTQPKLAPAERTLVLSALRHFDGERYELLAYVVMDDHVHVLVSPVEKYALEDIIHSWKSYTANRLQRESRRKSGVWQQEYFDRVVRDEQELIEKMQYILNNPRKRWPEVEEYPWVGAKGTEE